jgi:hypothetical protein
MTTYNYVTLDYPSATGGTDALGINDAGEIVGSYPQESPHFENGVISRLFGPHAGRKEGPKVPH